VFFYVVYLRFISVLELRTQKHSIMTAEVEKKQGLSAGKCVLVALSFVIAVLAVFASINVLTPELWTGMIVENFKITDVQFGEGLVKVTVKNLGDEGERYRGVGVELVTVAEVMVECLDGPPDLNESVPYKVPMSLPIHSGEQGSIGVGYDWTPGKTYQIIATTSRGNNVTYTAVAP
jgi:hypothetical protein